MLQGRIHPSHTHENSPPAALLKHLQGNAPSGVGGNWSRRRWYARLLRRRLRWQRRGGQGSLLGGDVQQPGPEVGVAGGEIHGGKAQPMALDVHRFIHFGVDGWMEKQTGG
jgi:hypothetical protein